MQSQSAHDRKSLLVITALGIVYGDIGTSPLYAIREVFLGTHAVSLSQQNILGVLSLIVWSLLFIISFKYLQFVLRADNRGEGGILALTALALLQKDKKLPGSQIFLYLGLFGAALIVGDSMITPAISVLSAVEGIHVATPAFSSYVIPITFVVLVALFYFQHKGTQKIGVFFGPIMLIWFTVIGALGAYSVVQEPTVVAALNPYYAFQFWWQSPHLAFLSMCAVFLVVTGGEALFADMGHLGREAISRGWFYVALPSLLLNYFGQGALLLRSPEGIENPFYLMAPSWGLIPLVALATVATIIASQAVISGFFSMASQCVQLGYSPRLEIVHTSDRARGQIYVPLVNWITFAGALWLVMEFKTSSSLAGAYGITISLTMVITSLLTAIVAHHTWGWGWKRIGILFSCFLITDCVFLAANLLKIEDGGWIPVMIAIFCFILMTTWKKGRTILYQRLWARSYPLQSLFEDLKKLKPVRVPGSAIFMVGDTGLTPPALLHNLKHNKVLHETVIFLTVVGEEISRVSDEDKVQVVKLADGFYRVTGHYGFSERPNVMDLLKRCELLDSSFRLQDPTFFMGREILVAGDGEELSFWRKILFSFMARNAASANEYFKLPLDRVIEVGMQIEL